MVETLDEPLTADITTASASWRKRPDANNDHATTNEDNPVTIDVLANDLGALGIVKVNGAQISESTPPLALNQWGDTVDLVNNKLLFDPGTATGDREETFTYTVAGKYKGTDTATVKVSITYTDPGEPGENQPPVAADDKAYLPNYYVYPMPYEQAQSTDLAVAPIDEGPIMTTLAIGEEGDPSPYPNDVTIDVLANDTDPNPGDKLTVTQIDGKDVTSRDTVKLGDSSGSVTLNADGSLFYDGADDYVGIDPVPLAEQGGTANSGETSELVSIPYREGVLVDSFTYSVSDGTLADEGSVNIYRMSDWNVLDTEPTV